MYNQISKFIVLLLLTISLAACKLGTQSETPSVALPTETTIPTPAPTSTESSPLVILVLPADMDQASYDLYQKTVYELAQQAGFRFQVRNTLSEADLEPALRVVIVLSPDPGPGLAALAAAAPQTQFLAINIPNLSAGGNVSVLANAVDTNVVAFMAGYIGALITDDYRLGMILPKDNPTADIALNAYNNGMVYYCGTCTKFYLYTDEYGQEVKFPQSITIPVDENPAVYSAYAEFLIKRKVAFMYVYPDLATPEFLAYVGNAGLVQVGSSTPNPKPLYWAASLQSDVVGAIQAAWPNLVAGQGGRTVQSPLSLTDVDSNLLSPGRQAKVEQVLADLQAGRISTSNVP